MNKNDTSRLNWNHGVKYCDLVIVLYLLLFFLNLLCNFLSHILFTVFCIFTILYLSLYVYVYINIEKEGDRKVKRRECTRISNTHII